MCIALLFLQFKFIVEKNMSLPIDPKFWNFLLSNAQKDWGLFVYEQDALAGQFEGTKALQVKHALKFNQWLLSGVN